ncbi:type II secretion system F family protein [Fulvimarina sp. MAC3]|uniref:type II secretion system F family protein n=1 Tax=Fulvimarina sp. MAC3 TaxID=3148887 RepID=UPI0031FD8683
MIAELDPALQRVLIFTLTTASVTGIAFTLLAGRLSSSKSYDERFASIAGAATNAKVSTSHGSDGSRRKRSVEATLKEAEEKHKAALAKTTDRPSLVQRMRQADIAWSKSTYFAVSLGVAITAFALCLIFSFAWYASLGFSFAAGLLLPHLFVSFKRTRRLRKFADLFPTAVDVVVRGIKSGLPLPDCLRIIATEIEEPVRSEFKTVVEDQTIGVPIEEALKRLVQRVPLSETNFFAIVIGVQARTGGSLAEALGNLSKVLRERKKMSAKVQSMSQEAKTSGAIIGAMPVLVGLLVYFSNPEFISVLGTTTVGNIILFGCAIWMLIGIFVMKTMINFDF